METKVLYDIKGMGSVWPADAAMKDGYYATIEEARTAWERKNPGMRFPADPEPEEDEVI